MKKPSTFLKFILDFGPFVAFIISYRIADIFLMKPIILATWALGLSTLASLIVKFSFKIAQEKISLYSNIAIILFASLTIIFNNPIFIKIKITAINLALSGTMYYAYFTKKPFAKHLFMSAVNMEDHYWLTITVRFAILFLAIAIANEIVWRTMSESFWVSFKVFVLPITSLIFFLLQIPFFAKHGTINRH